MVALRNTYMTKLYFAARPFKCDRSTTFSDASPDATAGRGLDGRVNPAKVAVGEEVAERGVVVLPLRLCPSFERVIWRICVRTDLFDRSTKLVQMRCRTGFQVRIVLLTSLASGKVEDEEPA
jgi:hypothetical protein